jgi:hypothetical protein
LGDREKYIGWTNDERLKKVPYYTANGQTIVAVQPFGQNFLGGKLMACLITSQPIRDEWKRKYNNTLVAMTTTSLYGGLCVYDRIPCWHRLGETTGDVALMPDKIYYEHFRQWFYHEEAEQYEQLNERKGKNAKTNQKSRINAAMFKSLGIDMSIYNHGIKRGIYFSSFYDNARDFLCGRITEGELIPKKHFDVLEWWKSKSLKQYNKLKSTNRLQTEPLWMDDTRFMTWEQTKAKYL